MSQRNPLRFVVVTALLLELMAFRPPAHAEETGLTLCGLMTDNAVLQRQMVVPLWGTAPAGSAVAIDFNGQVKETIAAEDGSWKVKLDPMEAGGPCEMTITNGETVKVLKNLLIGEVWICAGQSNMVMGVGHTDGGEEAIASATFPQIRLFTVKSGASETPVDNVGGDWKVCSPETVAIGQWNGFSAVGYFFGRELHQKLGVPVGLVQCSYGGSPIIAWMKYSTVAKQKSARDLFNWWEKTIAHYHEMEDDPEVMAKHQAALDRWNENGRKGTRPRKSWTYRGASAPGQFYNGKIHPLAPWAFRGAVWYQGEAESRKGQAEHYGEWLTAMIEDWRQTWKQEEFAFHIAALANTNLPVAYAQDEPRTLLRWNQYLTAKHDPQTGFATQCDVLDSTFSVESPRDNHPRNKLTIARRLALSALGVTYGQDIVYSGPEYKSMAVEGSALRLTFDHIGSGLGIRKGDKLRTFFIAGKDKKFVQAEAIIDGDTVIVSSDQIAAPAHVRYCWLENGANGNLMNREGLPALPFATDK